MIASLIAISLLAVIHGPVSPNPIGTWVLNKAKSDFGAAGVPRQFVVRLDETEKLLSVMMLIVDVSGKRIGYREYVIQSQPEQHTNPLLPINSDHLRNEDWQVTADGELVIRRFITMRSSSILQRLVFDRSATVE